MNKQQAFLFSLGAEIHDICQKHGISYFLGCGTLIGAVRHGGIIPWDDDFDILMPYEDWLRFKEVCQDPANLPANRMLCAPDLQESYTHIMPRYVATDTTCVHKNQSLHEDYAGYVIDIFILDPVSSDPAEQRAYSKDLFLYYDMVSYASVSCPRAEATLEEYEAVMAMRERDGKIAAAQEFERRIASHFDPKGDIYIHRWQGSGTQYRRSDFEGALPVKVGPYEFMIPRGYNGVLRASFNDEWPEMPHNASATKHSAPESLEFSYKDALAYYRPTEDRAELLNKMLERRIPAIESAPYAHYLSGARIRAKGRFVALELEHRLADCQEAFSRALAERDGVALNEMLGRYPGWQIDGQVVGRRTAKLFWRTLDPVIADVPDDVYDALLLALVCTERIGRAHQILRVSKQVGRPITEHGQEILADIELFRSATDDVCFGRIDDALGKARILKSRYPKAKTFWWLEVECLDRLWLASNDQAALSTLESALEDALAAYPEDGFFLKYQADCSVARGLDVGDAYLRAAERTSNGLLLSDIQQRFGYAPSWLRNKPWAKANGVPQWEGAAPKPPAKPVKPIEKLDDILNENQRCLVAMLQEIAAVCDELGLRYACSKPLSQALSVKAKKGLPTKIEDYSFYMPAPDLVKLAQALPGRVPNRRVRHIGNDASVADLVLEYRATKSCLLNMRRNPAKQDTELRVFVHALLPEQMPEIVGRLLRAWKSGTKKGEFSPRGIKAQAYCLVHGLRGRSEKVGKRLFGLAVSSAAPVLDLVLASCATDTACSVEASEGQPATSSSSTYDATLVVFGTKEAIPASALTNYDSCDFAGASFRLPSDLKPYISGCEAEYGRFLDKEAELLITPYLSYEDVLRREVLDRDWHDYRLKYEEIRKDLDDELSAFRKNYSQLRLAVKLKSLSLKLIPQKDHIEELHAAGDIEPLRKLLKGYVSVWDKYHEIGEVFLDKEIDEALQFVLNAR